MKQKLLLSTILSACFFTFPQAGIAQELRETVVAPRPKAVPKARIIVKPPALAYDDAYMTRDYADDAEDAYPDRYDGHALRLK